jgi:hypothetical protein
MSDEFAPHRGSVRNRFYGIHAPSMPDLGRYSAIALTPR